MRVKICSADGSVDIPEDGCKWKLEPYVNREHIAEDRTL